ncbi:MAG: hypothetical protein M1831_004812 [Alyxoria varia]|nr:MAG: hypothetical protein M1831_004812 [Alyxoria varia]
MQYTLAIFGFVAAAIASPSPVAQGVAEDKSPSGSAPPGCSSSYPNTFYISTVKPSGDAKMVKRQSPNLAITLENGILRDQDGNQGYVASNKQFQFVDGESDRPQAGTIYSSGFSICQNNSLALGPTTTFQSCNSGEFDNLYYGYDAEQCEDVLINAIDTGDSSDSTGSSSAAPSASPSATPAPSAPSAAAAPSYGGAASPTPVTPSASLAPTGTAAPASYTGAAAATAAPLAMAAAGAFLALL